MYAIRSYYVRQAGTCRSPACAAIGGEKDAATPCPGVEIRARDGKAPDISARQAGTCRCPACAIIGGEKDAVV